MGGHGATSSLESLLEVISCDHRHRILDALHLSVVSCLSTLRSQSPSLLLGSNRLSDGSLCSPLAKLSDVGTRKILGELSAEVKCDVWRYGTLSQIGLEYVDTRSLVRQWDVDQLIETARSDEGLVEDIWSISGSDEEQILLLSGTVHLGQKLVKHSVTSSATACSRTTSCANRIQLIEK